MGDLARLDDRGRRLVVATRSSSTVPRTGRDGPRSTFINTNEPVPYVFFVMPDVNSACPNSAAC